MPLQMERPGILSLLSRRVIEVHETAYRGFKASTHTRETAIRRTGT